MDSWLHPLREQRAALQAQGAFDGKDEKEKALVLVEANVRKAVDIMRKNPEVVKAAEERGLKVHGVIYDVGTGELRELDTEEGENDMQKRMQHFKVK